MRKNSKNKCYPDNYDNNITSHLNIEAYPKDIKNPLEFILDGNVVKYDNFSGNSIVSLSEKYKDDKDPLYVTMDGIDAMTYGIEMLKLSQESINFELYNGKKYKNLFMLSNMVLRKQIDSIYVYCKGVASENKESPLASRYIIVISGYCDNKCKIDFEVITEQSFLLHPTSILGTINKNIKDYPIKVNVDKESFNEAIAFMSKDNKYNRDVFKREAIMDALHSIDKYKK